MRVVMAKRFGGPEVLTVAERPDPTPGTGEVVLDVAFAQVLFLDVQLRRGWGRDYAEQVNVPSENLFQVPDGLDLADALAALSDGFMALSRLAAAPVAPEG